MNNNLKKALTNLKQKKFSLINIYPSDVYEFEEFRKTFKGKLDNFVIIQNKNKFNIEGIKLFSVKTFQEKEVEFFEKTKNGIAIWHKNFEKLEGLQAYYPIIYIKDIDDEEEFKEEFKEPLNDWQEVYYQNEKLMVLYNKNIKSFQTFLFKDFTIDKYINLSDKKVEIETKLKSKDYINYDIFNNLPKPTIYPPDRTNGKWCQEFYNYILELLKIIVPKEKERMIPYIINKGNLKHIWLRAFTYFTTSPEISENYETFEHIGDRALKHAFIDYYYERYPYSTAADLTNAAKQTQSDEEQGELSKKMGLDNWIYLEDVLKNNLKVQEDLLESFAGALDMALYQANIIGGSIPILNNLFRLIYEDRDLQTGLDASTWLNQFIARIAPRNIKSSSEEKVISLPRPKQISYQTYKKIIENANEILEKEGMDGILTSEKVEKDKKDTGIVWDESITDDNQIRIDVRLNDYGVNVLNDYGFNFKKNQILGYVIEKAKKPAKRHASDKAVEFLEKHGINEKWVVYQNTKKKMSDFGDLEDKVLMKAKQKHKDIVLIGIAKKELKKDKIFALYGENKKGYKYLLETYVSEGEPTNNYKIIAKKFLNIS